MLHFKIYYYQNVVTVDLGHYLKNDQHINELQNHS